MKNIIALSLMAVVLTLAACRGTRVNGKGQAITHKEWTVLLKKHVNDKGLVDYKGFIKDAAQMDAYLAKLSANPPGKGWSENERLAYWYNAYNAFTIKLIMNNYPVKSIKDLGPKTQIIFINTPWDKKFIKIGNQNLTLNNIEHGELRKNYKEPRMHFAINCASISCPQLRNEAYEASILDKQLTEQAQQFLADKTKNEPNASKPKLSSIFKWFSGDFEKTGLTKIAFINQYSPIKLNDGVDIQYLDYNWNLNEQK